MQGSVRRAALAAALLAVAVGCTRTVVQQNKQPPDPLLVSKKPVEGKPMSGPTPRALARIDPQPPSFPESAVAPPTDGQAVTARLSSELIVRPAR
jgi:hypothetical protein